MSQRLAFGTVAVLFESPQAAERAVETLVQKGYPRALVTVLTGRPWEDGAPDDTGILPDVNLRVQLAPASSYDAHSLRGEAELDPKLAAFASGAFREARKQSNRVALPLMTLALSLVVTLIALFATRDWFLVTTVALIALHVVVGVTVLTFSRDHIVTFPFRSRIPVVEDILAQGGVLVTVRCTLPYRSEVEGTLSQAGGNVLGYAPRVFYPVPA